MHDRRTSLSLPPPIGSDTGRPGHWSRRRFLTAVVVAAAASACSGGDGNGDDASGPTSGGSDGGPTSAPQDLPVPDLPDPPFTLGVASGDPLPDSVILWTRLAPQPLEGGGMPDVDVPVEWEVAADEDFAEIVARGAAVARPTLAHSVHVDATGLEADTRYWYRFRVGDHESATGRTRTAPANDATPERLAFATASCQHWEDGFWTAHQAIAADDLDLVLFLGDYIYEGDADPAAVRQHNSGEVASLSEYRNRYGLYKGDEHLQAAHASVPWVITWDDHEVDNNYAGLAPEDGAIVDADGFPDRRTAAYQAWYEHMPVRLDPPDGADLAIHRTFRWGTLVDVFVLDTRQYRTDQGCGDATLDLTPACDDIDDPERTLLGSQQEQWLLDGLAASDTTWRIMANQVVFGNVMLGEAVINYDQWDGYPASRRRVLQHIADNEIDNVVVVTGDIHFSACGNLRLDQFDTSSPILATEFVGTSVSSELSEDLVPAVAAFADVFEDVIYSNGANRGYVRCLVTPETWTTDYVVVETAKEPTSTTRIDATFEIAAGTAGTRAIR